MNGVLTEKSIQRPREGLAALHVEKRRQEGVGMHFPFSFYAPIDLG